MFFEVLCGQMSFGVECMYIAECYINTIEVCFNVWSVRILLCVIPCVECLHSTVSFHCECSWVTLTLLCSP